MRRGVNIERMTEQQNIDVAARPTPFVGMRVWHLGDWFTVDKNKCNAWRRRSGHD